MRKPRDTLKIGFVGCGEVTRCKHLVVLREAPGLEVVALADSDPRSLGDVARRFGIRHCYPDITALLRHPGLDIIAVCVPVQSHAQVALSVLEAGKHLFLEKPLCLTLDEADLLQDRASRSPGKVLVGHHMRWHRLVRKARTFIQQGGLGTLESVRTLWNSPRIGRHNPPWRTRRQDGGGVLVEIAVHCFDLWRYLLHSEVEVIHAFTSNGDRDDETLAVNARMANGMLASGLCSERAPNEIEVEISGTGGRLRLGCLRFEGFEFHPAGTAPGKMGPRLRSLKNLFAELPVGLAGRKKGGDYFGSYRAEWLHFREVIHQGTDPGCTLEDGRRSLEIVLAAAESASVGQPVSLACAPRILSPAVP